MTLKNNRAPLLSNIKLYASFHQHMWIQTGVTVRKRLSWVMTSVTLTFDLWPWPFAWTLRRSLVITPESFMMIRWWEHSQKGVTDRRTENTICRAAWSQLKTDSETGQNWEWLSLENVLQKLLYFKDWPKTPCISTCTCELLVPCINTLGDNWWRYIESNYHKMMAYCKTAVTPVH